MSSPSLLASSAARVAFVVALVLVIGGLVVVVPRLVDAPGDSAIAGIAWGGAVLQSVVLLLVGWLLLPKRRISPATKIASAVLGATFCAGAGILLNAAAAGLGLEVFLVAPLNEELVKLVAIAVVLVALRSRLRGPLDGLGAGFFVGVGFALVENVLYAYSAGSTAEAWQSVIARGVTSVGTHGVFAGIAGAGLAYLIVSRGRAWGLAVAAVVLALGLHFIWDALALWVPPLVYLALAVVIYAAGIVAFVVVRRVSVRYELQSAATADGWVRADAGSPPPRATPPPHPRS
jgi:RsiW-degrading membrane proteinase PrsW (M82 family)